MIFTGLYRNNMIVILGSTGFIGKSLCNYFFQNNIPYLGVSSKEIDLVNKSSTNKLLSLLEKDTILIFVASITREKGDNVENMMKNINMAQNVALAILTKPVKKIVFISSIDVYGNLLEKITEKAPLDPSSFYGISKLASEMILQKVSSTVNIPILILRLGGIFGTGQSSKKYGPNSFITEALKNHSLTIYGDGKELRDLVFINDLVAIMSQLSLNDHFGIINIASGKSVSFMQITDYLKKILPAKFKIIKKPRTGLKSDFLFDNKKLLSVLSKNFKFTDLETALKITVDSATE